MKYIRTKDGQIIDFDFIKSYAYYYDFDDNKNQLYIEWYTVKKTFEIIKQADTIEELCDEFVLINKYRFRKPKTSTELEKDFEDMKSFYTTKDDEIYGAIWTDKGLVYVAKMNEKGELCLI